MGEYLGRPPVAECQAREVKLVELRAISSSRFRLFTM
jgi:hypothetical protein